MNRILYLIYLIGTGLWAQNLQNGLQVHYKFDGDILDNSVNGHHLQNGLGMVTYSTVSGSDQSAYFDGNDRLDQIGSLDNSTWTASAMAVWVKTSHNSSQDQSIVQGAYMGFGLYLESYNGYSSGFFDGSSSNSLNNTFSLTNNEWHHIVYQTNGTITSLYIDGVFIADMLEPYFNGNGGSNNKIYIGQAIVSPRPYTGYLNDCRIYNRALTLCEIQMLAGIDTYSTDTLTETSCLDYLWPQTNQVYTESGLYSDTLSNISGCDSIITLDLTISELDLTVTIGNGTLSSNATGVTYNWIDCDTDSLIETGQSFSPNYSGNFAVIVTDGLCVDTSDCYSLKNINVEDTYKRQPLKIITKPGNHYVRFELDQVYPSSIILIRDIRGKLVNRIKIDNNFIELYIHQIGVYFMEFKTKDKFITEKFLIH